MSESVCTYLEFFKPDRAIEIIKKDILSSANNCNMKIALFSHRVGNIGHLLANGMENILRKLYGDRITIVHFNSMKFFL